jgi:hypothetical protein
MTGTAPRTASVLTMGWSGGAALAWALMAAHRPTVTYHLAPVIVVAATPLVTGAWRALLLPSTALAGGTALLLDLGDLLRGPALGVADALAEAMVLIMLTAAILCCWPRARRRSVTARTWR